MKKDSNNAIEANGLSIGYPSKKSIQRIAEAIRFSIKKGELAAIVGSNGIGKSTLLRTLAKIQPSLSGTVRIQDRLLQDYGTLDLAKVISLVLTEPIASKNMTVSEIIELGRQPYTNWVGTLSDTDTEKVKDVITMVDLDSIAQKKCFELSDGQFQRVMIARALAQDTPIILLDEPTTHLDLYHKVQILKLLQRIAKETHKTIVFTSHDIDMAIELCDKMILMNSRETIFGTPEELIKKDAFTTLFPHDSVYFDSETRKFQFKA